MKRFLVWIGACSLALVAAAPAARAACGGVGATEGEVCVVTAADFAILRRAFQCVAGSSCYAPQADYDSDGVVGGDDFQLFRARLAAAGHDVTPPTVAIASPADHQTLRGVINVTVSAADDFGVGGVAIFVEASDPYPSFLSQLPYQSSLDTRTVSNGEHVIQASVIDFAGNQASHRIVVQIDNPAPPPAGSPPGVVVVDDLNGDGRYTGADLQIGLAQCKPGCTLRALARTYDDVEIVIPAELTSPVSIEGAGMGQTVFRSPVPWRRPVFMVAYPNPLVSFRDLTIDGRKAEQISSVVPRTPSSGIAVSNPWATDSGPGVIERVEVQNMLNAGISISGGNGWIVRYSRIHDNGCSTQFPCPNLRSIDPGAPLHDPTWQSVGYGVVIASSDDTVHDNEIWNINKIGIEAYEDRSGATPVAPRMSGFYFHRNFVHHAGGGIVSNGGSGGRIESNTVTQATAHGVYCGGPAGDLVFDDNVIADNNYAGLSVSCWGGDITVTNNLIGNNCRAIPGGGSGLLVDAGTQFGDGNGIAIRDNTIIEPFCRSASEVAYRDNVEISGNVFTGGNSLGTVVLHEVSNIVVRNTDIDGQDRVPASIFLLPNIDRLTVGRDVTSTGYTRSRYLVSDPGSVTNVVVE